MPLKPLPLYPNLRRYLVNELLYAVFPVVDDVVDVVELDVLFVEALHDPRHLARVHRVQQRVVG
jgi:hypothetical protein